ncbi:hypothetical protein [Microbacterium sp. ZW T5_56]|uniref:hypothetical protein n=1 Tax=Microbacterium sp. ZW T5_56 TaxID=3378081 RepID=UPI0038541587
MSFVDARHPVPADEGSDWLYRDPKKDRWLRVELLIVTDGAHRVKIQHLDRDMKSAAEWVPIGRCKVPWKLREDYFATEEAWARCRSHQPEDAAMTEAAQSIFLDIVPGDVAFPDTAMAGVLEIYDPELLAEMTGMPVEAFSEHPDAFVHHQLNAPWPTMLEVVKVLARRYPEKLLSRLSEHKREVDEREKERLEQGDPWYVDEAKDGNRFAGRIIGFQQRNDRAMRLIAGWVGHTDDGLAERHIALRDQHVELVLAVLPVFDQLRMLRTKKADALIAELRELIERPMP